MKLWLSKLISLVVMLILTLIAGLLPIRLTSFLMSTDGIEKKTNKISESNVIISQLNCFCGGVFLAVTMIHLLPEVRHDFHDILEQTKQRSNFPLAEFTCCVGFFVIMFIETLVIQYSTGRHLPQIISMKSPEILKDDPGCSPAYNDSLLTARSYTEKSQQKEENYDRDEDERRASSNMEANITLGKSLIIHDHHSYGTLMNSCRESFSKSYTSSKCNMNQADITHEQFHANEIEGDESAVEYYDVDDVKPLHLKRMKLNVSHCHKHMQSLVMTEPENIRLMRSLILLIAFSIHTVFEGLALGLQESTTQVWTMFTAIMVHKVIMAFTLCLRLMESLKTTHSVIIYMTIFSLTSPLGGAIGLLVTEVGRAGLVTTIIGAILQGLATGTFVYVTFFEVLCKEMTKYQNCAKVLAILFGFTCIALIELFHNHNHNHSITHDAHTYEHHAH